MIKKVSIQRDPEPELNKAENAWKPSKLEPKAPGAATSEEEQSEVCACGVFMQLRYFDSTKNVAAGAGLFFSSKCFGHLSEKP